MRYKKQIIALRKEKEEIVKPIREEHKNCCEKCQKFVNYMCDSAIDIAIKHLKTELNRKPMEFTKFKKDFCQLCGIKHNLHIHHIDNNRNNNLPENLKTLCGNCHVLIHSKLNKN